MNLEFCSTSASIPFQGQKKKEKNKRHPCIVSHTSVEENTLLYCSLVDAIKRMWGKYSKSNLALHKCNSIFLKRSFNIFVLMQNEIQYCYCNDFTKVITREDSEDCIKK